MIVKTALAFRLGPKNRVISIKTDRTTQFNSLLSWTCHRFPESYRIDNIRFFQTNSLKDNMFVRFTEMTLTLKGTLKSFTKDYSKLYTKLSKKQSSWISVMTGA